MLHAVSFALIDSINVLLIGIVIAAGVLIPARGPYAKVAGLLVAGDWLGVFLAAVPVFWLFSSIEDRVLSLLDSPIFGGALIVAGIIGIILTLRGGGSGNTGRLLGPLRNPSWMTFFTGMVMGAIQSLTSAPFYGGLAYLSTVELSTSLDIVALVLYASLALSLPTLCAIGIGFIRHYPESPLGRAFVWVRLHDVAAGRIAGYVVGALLIVLGVLHL